MTDVMPRVRSVTRGDILGKTGGTADWTGAGALCQREIEEGDGGPEIAEVRQEEEEERERKRMEEERKGERTRRWRVEVGWNLTAPATVECRSCGYAEELKRGEREEEEWKSGERGQLGVCRWWCRGLRQFAFSIVVVVVVALCEEDDNRDIVVVVMMVVMKEMRWWCL
ncbi:uncharacterized protein DS421_8g249950 [Arachis hypogaea]|nr:uncharacterized protein DS421_8g249950 [Arachis hypogaea]